MAAPRYTTLYDALAVLTNTLFILGYTGFYKRGTRYVHTIKALAYTIVLLVFFLGGLIVGTYHKITDPDTAKSIVKMDKVLISILMLEIAMAAISFSINIISMLTKRKHHIRLMDHINHLDAQLTREFNVRMGYEKIAFKTSIILMVFCVYTAFVFLMFVLYSGLNNFTKTIGIYWCYTYIISGMQISTYGYMTIADVVRIRFRLLQKLLVPDYLRKHFTDGNVRESKLRQAIEIYRGLYEVIDELNIVYGLCLLSSMAHDFTLATILLYLMFGRSWNLGLGSNLMYFAGVLVTLIPPGYKMVMMPIYSTMSMEEGKKCMRAIKLMDDAFPGDGRIRQIVGAALLWSNHNKVEYKIGHTITSNKGMMAAVITAIVNYVAIMIQFQIQEEVLTKEKEKRSYIKESN